MLGGGLTHCTPCAWNRFPCSYGVASNMCLVPLHPLPSRYMWDGDLFALLDWCVQNVPARYRYEICKKLVQTSISKGALDREQASTTLLTLVRMGIVSVDQAVEGFYRLLWCIDELCLDEPSTPDMVARFIVRAIADEVLPTDFLDTIPDSVLVAKRCVLLCPCV